MPSRYESKTVVFNSTEQYSTVLEEKRLKFINQYPTPQMNFVTAAQTRDLNIRAHIWKLGDKFYKLADKHYANPEYWWIIAWFNQTPTEFHVAFGDIIKVPHPLERVLQIYEV